MKISTFKDDLFELEKFANRLKLFIETEHKYVEGSLVLALSSKYGSGKTTFLDMWKASLEEESETSAVPLVISLNAWDSDYYGDPLFAIVSALVESLEAKGKGVEGLVHAAKDLGWFFAAIGGQIANKFTGVDVVAAAGLAEKKNEERGKVEQIIPSSFSMYQDRKTAMGALKKEIASFVAASEPRVIFLVDELDRCRPDYAISYLETIKHIFDIKGAVFLLAADRHQLENSAKTAFGQDLDFEEYYRKFIHREVVLPPISEEGYNKLASKYVSYYLEQDDVRNCFMALGGDQVDRISELIGALKLTPRQIQEAFRILGHLMDSSAENKGRMLWCLAVGSILMAVLKIGEPRIYRLLAGRQLESEEAVDYFSQLMQKDDHDVEWWFKILLSGDGLKLKKGEAKVELMRRAGFEVEEAEARNSKFLEQYTRGWGRRKNALTEICEKIEHISQWS